MALLCTAIAAASLILSASASARSSSPAKYFADPSVGEFRELLVDEKSGALFVGAEGAIFRLWAYNVNDTSDNVFVKRKLVIDGGDESECRALGHSDQMCRPSTRFLSFINNNENIYVCSAVGMKPEIRVLDAVNLRDQQDPRTQIGICAPDASINATAVVVEWGNPDDISAVYSGIRTGMSGENHLIYRPPLEKGGRVLHTNLRTEYKDNKWLNEPQFVASFDAGDHVFFFFREVAYDNAFGDKVVHSRVARVCKKDIGGRNVLRQVWTSFLKARLNCSISSNSPYYFDHIQAVTRVEKGGDTLFYASFSTSNTAFVASAICVFPLSSVNRVLDNSLLMEETKNGWAPIVADSMPSSHRPGSCSPNSHSISDSDLHYVKTHLLVSDTIPGGSPIHALRDAVYTHLTVDALPGQNVIFAVDANSKVLWKFAHWKDSNEWKYVLLEKRQLPVQERINDIALLPTEFVFASSRNRVSQYSVADCGKFDTCAVCTLDPYCSWNVANSSCHQRQKSHETSVGWISSSLAGRVTPECKLADQPVLREVYLGDGVRLATQQPGVWTRNGAPISEDERRIINSQGHLVILDVQPTDAGLYLCTNDFAVVSRLKVSVQENCVRPTSVSEYKSCQREWCKKADAYKAALNVWSESSKKSLVQC